MLSEDAYTDLDKSAGVPFGLWRGAYLSEFMQPPAL